MLISSLYVSIILCIIFKLEVLALLLSLTGLIASIFYLVNYGYKSDSVRQLHIKQTRSYLRVLQGDSYDSTNLRALKRTRNPFYNDLLRLYRSIQEKNDKIFRRTEKLKRRNIQNINILSTISHEIKNPLSIIDAGIHTVIKNPMMDVELRNKLLHKTLNYSSKINSLLNKLSLTASLEHNLIKVNYEYFDVCLLCNDAIDGINSAVKENKNVVIECEERIVYADKILYEQLLINLLHNAFKYSHKEIVVRVRKRYMEIFNDGEYVDKDELKLLAKKFFRARNSDVSDHNSLGLGLFIVREIVRIHNQRISFDSCKGGGFKVRIDF